MAKLFFSEMHESSSVIMFLNHLFTTLRYKKKSFLILHMILYE